MLTRGLPPNPWYVGIVAGMASYIDSAAIITNGTALVILQKSIGMTPKEIGILSGFLTLFIAIGALIGGRLGDYYGRRKVFIITMIMIIIGALLMAFGTQFEFLLVGTLLVGFATGADLPVSLATISEVSDDKNRGKIIGLSHLLWTAGIVATMGISAIVGGWGKIAAEILYLHVAAVATVVLLLRWRIPESPLWLAAKEEIRQGALTIRARNNELKDIFRGKYLFPFISLCVFYTFTNLAANTNGQFGPYVAVNVVGIPIEKHSLIKLLIMPAGIIASIVFMRFVDTNKRIKMFLLGAILLISAYLLPVLFNFTLPSWIACLLFAAIGNGLAFEGIMKIWTQESFPTMIRSTAQGMIVAISRLACAILAFVTPILLNAGPETMYSVISAIIAIGLFVGWFCFHRNDRNEFANENSY